MADAMGPGLCQATPPSHATQPLNIRFGIGFMVALVLPLSHAQWLAYKKELPTCLRQACTYAWSGGVVGVCSCVVPLGSRRRGSWLPHICISSGHSSFLLVWWFRPFLHNASSHLIGWLDDHRVVKKEGQKVTRTCSFYEGCTESNCGFNGL
jgi:hypothetical protein